MYGKYTGACDNDLTAHGQAGLLDYVTPLFEQNEHMDPDLPFEGTAALVRKTPIWQPRSRANFSLL
jgi:hypothetical protein